MPSWKGTNQPNPVQEADNVSEVKKDVNRAHEVRRDDDTQKDFTVGLADVDEAILYHVNNLNLSVVDGGQVVKVPTYIASPDRWKSIQVDGYFRDYLGNMILPAIVFKRDSSEKDKNIILFNRYLRTSVLKKYSNKNRYTPFNALMGINVPVNDVYEVVLPDHMIFTYKFIIWTEKVSQMNKLVEEINFATEDYWGDKKRFKFRTAIDSFVHTIELSVNESRIVKTEFDLVVHGYLLPPQFDGKQSTTRKAITPKKIIMGMEVVSTGFKLDDENNKEKREKWRNQQYPNLPKDEEIPSPPISVWSDVKDGSSYNLTGDILDAFNKVKLPSETLDTGLTTQITTSGVNWKQAPQSPNDYGKDGWMAYDSSYLYVYANNKWRRVPINQFS